LSLPACEAVIEQVPAATATAFPEEIVHTEVEFEVKVMLNEADEEAVRVWLLSPTVIAEGEVNEIVCDALLNVNSMLALVAELYVESSALVAAIKQVPYLVAEIVAEDELFERLQFSAVPPETIA
jgi:hypothetical protein